MKNLLLSLVCLSLAPSVGSSALAEEESGQSEVREYDAIQTFMTALRKNDRKAIAALLEYPVRRTRPLPPVKNQKEFLEVYEQFFDAGVAAELEKAMKENDFIVKSDATGMGSGQVWSG